jgi:hypothetical protein
VPAPLALPARAPPARAPPARAPPAPAKAPGDNLDVSNRTIGGTSPSAIAMVTSPTGAPANQTLGRREHREEGNGRVPRQIE